MTISVWMTSLTGRFENDHTQNLIIIVLLSTEDALCKHISRENYQAAITL